MGNGADVKKRVFNKNVKLEFFSFHEEIINSIKHNIVEFFMNENFATRQSKGFGSFTVDKINDEVVSFDKSMYPSKYYFDVNTKKEEKVFEEIENFYKSLRSGIFCRKNGKYFTIDPMIKLYFESKNIIWDKKIIKDKIKNENSPCGKYLVKDLLGLSSSENWKFQHCTINKESITDKEIDRFKSPITFKIIEIKTGYRIFLILNDINPKFLNNEFSILRDNRKILKLITPDKFDLEDFIKYSINNIEEYLETNDVAKGNEKLLSIYEDIGEEV
jgi:nucleoside diphosphate kinase